MDSSVESPPDRANELFEKLLTTSDTRSKRVSACSQT